MLKAKIKAFVDADNIITDGGARDLNGTTIVDLWAGPILNTCFVVKDSDLDMIEQAFFAPALRALQIEKSKIDAVTAGQFAYEQYQHCMRNESFEAYHLLDASAKEGWEGYASAIIYHKSK